MRENNVIAGGRDRSYLCLVTIYAIHAILLNFVFLQPTEYRDSHDNFIVPSSYLTDRYYQRSRIDIIIDERNSSVSDVIVKIDRMEAAAGSRQGLMNNRTSQMMLEQMGKIVAQDFSTNDLHHRYHHPHDDSVESLRNVLSKQSRSGGAALHFFTAARVSELSWLMNSAVDAARGIVESLSPAAVGIISGCLVFFLTFTENDYV